MKIAIGLILMIFALWMIIMMSPTNLDITNYLLPILMIVGGAIIFERGIKEK